ncbi:hypothetical protein EAE96_002896 [Botrytis aclada]|nr:hypothetical protein EAE96_002896 [Botrytis aclada]
MLDFCLGLFCPGPGKRQKRERYTNPASLALSRPRRRYPVPTPVYPLSAPTLPPPQLNYEQSRPISPIYYTESDLDLDFEPEPELFYPQAFQRVPFDPDSRHRLEPAAQRIHFVEPEPEVYFPFPRPRSPPRQHIHFVQQLLPPYIPSPPPSPTTHHIHVLPPPRKPSPPHTHIHLLGPAPPPRIATPPVQTLALVPLPKVRRKMNFSNHPHSHHHHNHNHNQRHRSPSSSPSRSPSPLSHPHHSPHNHANNQQNNPNNLNNIPLADLIRDILHRYLQINLPPGTAISIARLMSNSRNPNSNLSTQANAGTVRNRSRSRSQGRGRRGGNKNNNNGNRAANGYAVGSGRRGNVGNRQAVMSSDSGSDSSDRPAQKSKTGLDEDIRRVNMCAQVANGIIKLSMLNAEIHPKLDAKGRYPKDFQRPLKVKDFLAMDTKTLDALLITYDLSKVTRHRSDPAALSVFMAHLAQTQNNPNNGTQNPPCDCKICAPVHEEQKLAKREALLEHLCVGALHGESGAGNLLAYAHGQGHGHGQGQAQAQAQLTRAGGAVIAGNAGGGGGRGGGGNQGPNANANANAAGYLILPQPGHAIQVQNVQGAVPNRLNNNNIGLAQPSVHAAHSHHASQHHQSQHLGGGGVGNGQGRRS